MAERPSRLSDDHHLAIARVAIEAARLEWQIEKTIESAFRPQPKAGEFLLKNLGTDRVVGLLKAILLDLHPDEATQIDNLIKTIADLRTERNELLHWTWAAGTEPGTHMSITHRPYREVQIKEWTIGQIHSTAQEMRDTGIALVHWRDLLHERFRKSSPDTPEPQVPPASSVSP